MWVYWKILSDLWRGRGKIIIRIRHDIISETIEEKLISFLESVGARYVLKHLSTRTVDTSHAQEEMTFIPRNAQFLQRQVVSDPSFSPLWGSVL